MPTLRSLLIWSLVSLQIWSPVLAQTLPISVDRNVPGQRPVVGVAGNGVPIVNIAPPSAGGVSNNKFTQFNVGPSGVVLNNSGAASQTQLAGGVAGNPMLGNRRASTILNQVTSANPSQLKGAMEVAGSRANVIIANPAGITCDGCGFLNANRASLTTGTPILGADGSVNGFNVVQGTINVQGQGLYGSNVSQVDLIGRSLEINAAVWAQRLQVVGGAAQFDYQTGAVQAQAGAGAPPSVSIDVAALGGMYANSIRLIGTEAGVGVNAAGIVQALTGDLQVSANGDVRVAPGGALQAVGNAQIASDKNIVNSGTIVANGAASIQAAGNIQNDGAMVAAGGNMSLASGGLFVAGVNARTQAAGSLGASVAGTFSNAGLMSAGGALTAQAANTQVDGTLVASGGDLSLTSFGNINVGAQAHMQAAGNLHATAAQAFNDAGIVSANHAVTLQSGGSTSVNGALAALGGDLGLTVGGAMTVGMAGSAQASGNLVASIGGGYTNAGLMTAGQAMSVQAADAQIGGTLVAAGGDLQLNSGANIGVGAHGRVQAAGNLHATAAQAFNAAGIVSANSAVTLQSGAGLSVDGALAALGGDLNLTVGGAMTVGTTGRVQAAGNATANVTQAFSDAGLMSADHALTLHAADVRVDGTLIAADGDLRLTSTGNIAAGSAAKIQAAGNLSVGAAGSFADAGLFSANNAVKLDSGGAMSVDGAAVALGGDLAISSGSALSVGSGGAVQASGNVIANVGADFNDAGLVSADHAITLKAGNVQVGGAMVASGGDLRVSGNGDVAVGAAGRMQAAGDLWANADGNFNAGGVVSANGGVTVHSGADAAVTGTMAALNGNLGVDAGGAISVGQAGIMQASAMLTATAGRDINALGALSAGGSAALRAGNNLNIGGTVAAMAGTLDLAAINGDLSVVAAGGAQATGNMSAQAGRDLLLAGALLTDGGALLQAGRDIYVEGIATASSGNLTLAGTRDVYVGAAGRAQAGGNLAATGRDLFISGVAAANGGVNLQASRNVLVDGTAAALGGTLDASGRGDVMVAGTGRLQSSGVLTLSAGGGLTQAGIVTSGASANLSALDHVSNSGTVASAGDAMMQSDGQFANSGKIYAGVTDDGELGALGSIGIQAASLSNTGTMLSGKDATLSAAILDLANGTLGSNGAVRLVTAGTLENRGATLSGNTVDIQAASLDNHAGSIAATSGLTVQTTGGVDNSGGTLAANGIITVGANALNNQQGIIVAGGVTLGSALIPLAALDNTEGLIQADGALSVHAGSLVNRNTVSGAAGSVLGISGNTVDLALANFDNTSGSLTAGQALTVTTAGTLANAGGVISSSQTADISAQAIGNEQGKLLAGTRLGVLTGSLTGAGLIQSQGDLSLTVGSSFTNLGSVIALHDLTLGVAGALDNAGIISAGHDLALSSVSLNNRSTGQILAQGTNHITVAQGLVNDGLIDGGFTRIDAGQVTNTGRIYGDRIAIGTGTLLNDVGTQAGVIASRGAMDLGAGTLTNREGALIYASGDLKIGGALDASGNAIGQAQSLVNSSATIEADGNAVLSAASIQNLNNHFASTVVQTDQRQHVYYRLPGNTDLIDGDGMWLCNRTKSICSTDPNWVGNQVDRRLLLPSTTYPQDHYGPPFDYSSLGGGTQSDTEGAPGFSTPVGLAYIPPQRNCTGGDSDSCGADSPAQYVYGPTDRVWSIFGVNPPQPVPSPPLDSCLGSTCVQQQAAYDQAMAANQPLYDSLNAKIEAFNADFETRLVTDFTIYQVNEVVSESQTVSSDPGKIVIGGNAAFTGAVTNDKSQIVAGGTLSITGPSLNNIGAVGQRTLDQTGTASYTYDDNGKRKYERSPYSNTAATQAIELAVGTVTANTVPPVTGATRPGASSLPGAAAPAAIVDVSIPGAGTIRTVSAPPRLPTSALYQIVTAPDAPYLVSTDSRFLGQHQPISSDLLLQMLNPLRGDGSLSGTAAHNASLNVSGTVAPSGVAGAGGLAGGAMGAGAPVIPPGAGTGAASASIQQAQLNTQKQVPDSTLKRLGDGFYEQKMVDDQIMAATGQRFVGDYTDDQTEYTALLTAGATFANQYGLTVGTALTEEQMSHLTGDIVWLVEQTVTLPDGSTQQVLAPQVYLAVQPDDLKGDGTLIAGKEVNVQTSGDVNNSGTVASRDATVFLANNVNNTVGTIAGQTVDLTARTDLNNLAGLIKGDDVSLTAGRDINLTTTTQSGTGRSTSSTIVSGVSKIDAGSLMVSAGQNLNATAASITATGDIQLSAAANINLNSVIQDYSEAFDWGKENQSSLSRSADIGTAIQAGGNLLVSAGGGISATAAQLSADKTLAVMADGNISLNAGQQSSSVYDEHYQEHHGFWSSSSQHTIDASSSSQALGSVLTGDSIAVVAGGDINMTAAQVAASKNIDLEATGSINIAAGQNTHSEDHYEHDTKSGFFGGGGLGISYGSQDAKNWSSVGDVTQSDAGSIIGTSGGNVIMTAGQDVHVTGSSIIAGRAAGDTVGLTGNIDVQGSNIVIDPSKDTEQTQQGSKSSQSGFGIALVGTPLDTLNNLSHAGSAKDFFDEIGHSSATAAQVAITLDKSRSSSNSNSITTATNGSDLSAAGNIVLHAVGNGAKGFGDITVVGSSIQGGGTVILDAQHDISITSATSTYAEQDKSSSKTTSIGLAAPSLGDVGRAVDGTYNSSGVSTSPYNSQGSNGKGQTNASWETSSVITGNTVNLNSHDGDIRVVGSAIAADGSVAIVASNGSVDILAGTQTHDSSQSYDQTTIGSLGGTASSASVGWSHQSGTHDDNSQTQSDIRSSISSGSGDVTIGASGSVLVSGSDIAAGRDVTLVGRDVTIDPGYDNAAFQDTQKSQQVAVTASANNAVVSAVQTAHQMQQAGAASGDPRLQALAATAAGLSADNAYDAVMKDPEHAGGISVNVNVGANSGQSNSSAQSTTSSGSTISGGRDVIVVASGAGQDSDITVVGSNISAGRNVALSADGDLLLQAAQNTTQSSNQQSSSSGSIGVGFGIGAGASGAQSGVTINLAASTAHGSANGEGTTWSNTHVQAGNTAALMSGGDTTLLGAQVSGDRIVAEVGGNLLVQSLQDIDDYTSKDRSGGVSVSLCIPPICYGSSSVSGNYSSSNINSHYASVTEQTGLWAGDGGFQIDVGKNTSLVGGVIASSDQAIADGRNDLSTGTLTVRDIDNSASYYGQQISLGGGYSFGGTKSDGDKSAVGQDQQGNAASGSSAVPGKSLPGFHGISPNIPVVLGASGSASSTTQSAISAGNITIRDASGQYANTGMTVAETIAALNRDTVNTLNGLDPIFDKDKVQAGFEIASTLTREVGTFLNNRAAEIDALNKRAQDQSLPADQRAQAALDAQKLGDEWGPSGTYRRVVSALAAAAGGNVTGDAAQFVQAAAVNYIQGWGVTGVKRIADQLDDAAGQNMTGARAALQAIVGCAGSAASNQSCSAGALGAGASTVINALLGKDTSKMSSTEKEAWSNLVESLVGGISAMSGVQAAAATTAAMTETDDNFLALPVPVTPLPGATTGSMFSTRTPQTRDERLLHLNEPQLSVDEQIAQSLQSIIHQGDSALQGVPGMQTATDIQTSVEGLQSDTTQTGGLEGYPGSQNTSIGVPGQENNGTSGGTLITTPNNGPQQTDPIFVNTDPTNQPAGGNASGTYGNDSVVWAQPPLVRGVAIESELSKTDYSPENGWYQVGAENNGYFPLVDFQKGNVLVSLKSVDTSGGAGWRSDMEDVIDKLGSNGATVNDVPANMVLDIRVQPGGADAAQSLVDYGVSHNVTVIIKVFP